MRILWLVLVYRFCAVVADIAYHLSGGCGIEHWRRSAWTRLYFWARIVGYGADSERGYRRAGLWPPRKMPDAR